MKKKWLNVLASVVCAAAMLLSPTIAWAAAGESEWTATASDSNPEKITAGSDSGNSATSIDVEASVENAGDKIRYSVKISYGAMQFMYDYGQVWDPESHTYIPGSSGLQKGGWVTSYLDGENNRITVTNDSNYPITVNFDYSPSRPSGSTTGATYFNSSASAEKAVIGIFTKDNDTLAQVNDSNYQGNKATMADTLKSSTVNLDWDYQALDPNEYQNYGKLKDDDTNYRVNSVNMYFSLCGIPDEKCKLANESIANGGAASSVSKVGTITVKVKPCADSEVDKTPNP